MVSSALFRLAVFAINERRDHCYRFTFSYLGRPLPNSPFPEVEVTYEWVVEPAVFADTNAGCRLMASDWTSGGIRSGLGADQIRGYAEIEVNPPQTDPMVKQLSAELTLEFEGDASTHATRLRFEDLQVGAERECH
jgi:hypothetical protein